MAKETVDVLIMGGKATAAPPLGPALGPKGVNIAKVVADINEKTKDYAGMQDPVKVIIESSDKSYEIEIGTPPATALVKQEAGLKKASGNAKSQFVGDISFDQALKIMRMKETVLTGKNTKQKVKEIVGTCQSMGITVDGKKAHDVIDAINAGEYDAKLK